MNRPRHYYKVTGKKLAEFLVDWHARRFQALEEVRKFSRRVGGHRKHIGTGLSWGCTYISVVFKNPPDRALWKKASKGSDEYWEPKRNKSSKALREEFDTLQKAVPTRGELDDFVKFNAFGGGDLTYYHLGAEKFDGAWILAFPDYYKPPAGLGIIRISDIAFEKLEAAKDKAAA